jgi:hypothetical protein
MAWKFYGNVLQKTVYTLRRKEPKKFDKKQRDMMQVLLHGSYKAYSAMPV